MENVRDRVRVKRLLVGGSRASGAAKAHSACDSKGWELQKAREGLARREAAWRQEGLAPSNTPYGPEDMCGGGWHRLESPAFGPWLRK